MKKAFYLISNFIAISALIGIIALVRHLDRKEIELYPMPYNMHDSLRIDNTNYVVYRGDTLKIIKSFRVDYSLQIPKRKEKDSLERTLLRNRHKFLNIWEE